MPTTKRDYYEILGIAKSATTDEIKRAYRALAMKHHPDRVPEEQKKEAEEKFKEISEAYAVLTDPQKRSVYDQYGHSGFDQRYSTEDIFRGADFSSVFQDMGLGGSIFEDLFGGFDLFGGGQGGARRGSRGADLEVDVPLSFEEAASGTSKSVTIPRREICSECRGEGGQRTTCSTCQGAGQVRQSAGFMVMVRTCNRCNGAGSALKKACPTCHGEGRVPVERKIQVKVPAGIESGMRLRLPGEGEAGTRGRGDLYVHVRVAPHPIFHRDGSHLIVDYPLTMSQAALGAEIVVPTTDGGRVSLKVPAGTQSGTILRARGKGLSDVHDGRRGDLLVRVTVETPMNLTSAQRRLLEDLGKSIGEEAYATRRAFLTKLKDLLKQ